MEFSFLDLLASTALRENNNLQQITPDPQHRDNAQETDDNGEDDETDGKANTLSAKDIAVVKTSGTCENNMGSVKCGAKKKPVSKTMVKAIFVRDGKCVAKEVSAAVVIPGKNGNSHTLSELANVALVDNLAVKNKLEAVDVLSNNNDLPRDEQEVYTDPEQELKSETFMCNGEKADDNNQILNDSSDGDSLTNGDVPIDEPEDGELNFFVAPSIVDPAPILCDAEAAQFNVELQARPLTSAALAAAASGALEVAKLCQKAVDVNDHNFGVSNSAAGTSNIFAESAQQSELKSCVGGSHHFAATPAEPVLVSDPYLSDFSFVRTLHSDTEAEEVGLSSMKPNTNSTIDVNGCNNCDENRQQNLVSSLSPTSSSSLSSSSSSSSPLSSSTGIRRNWKFAEKDSQMSVNVDQNVKSSGNIVAEPSSLTLLTMLSLPPPPTLMPPLNFILNSIRLDHCYFTLAARPPSWPIVDNTDDSCDALESADENVSADDIERRPRSLSVDSVYLQNGGVVAIPSPLDGVTHTERLPLLSPAPSVDSASNDSSMSEQSSLVTGGHFYSILTGSQTPGRLPSFPSKSALLDDVNYSLVSSSDRARVGASLLAGASGRKFQIGNFGSFSNSLLDLDGEAKNKLKIGIPSESVIKHSLSSPGLASPGSPFPLLQSPGMEWDRSDAGSEAPDDADSSTTEDRYLGSSLDSDSMCATIGQIWHHPVFHDHDYFCKEVSEKLGKPKPPPLPAKNTRRKQSKKKDRQMAEDKGKYLKMELLKQDNRFSLSSGNGSKLDSKAFTSRLPFLGDLQISKPNPVGRPRKRSEKPADEYDSETGTKMKITGKYQDQYVYYYSKTSRNRRRKFEDKVGSGDKIIIPTPKPGDIVVPHLTDADCEDIKKGGRTAFKGGDHSLSSSRPFQPPSSNIDQPELMDSSIVNTILSMENDSQWVPQPQSHDGEFDGFTSKLTTEQVDLLIDCLKQCDTSSSDLTNFLTTTDTVPLTSSALDSLAATTVEEDFLDSGLPHPVSTASCVPSTMSASTQPVSDDGMLDMKSEADVHSVEKNLEFLTNDFYTPVSSVSPTSVGVDFDPMVPDTEFGTVESEADVPADNETPWIVTVTLYYNDIPAIVINNRPFVRLVDIHKQILPAKDTGILKKRCQLMKIPVINCTEMQRYFLVQYGRAQNSKSTLVITKDEAWRLISYYAQPQPRNLRSDEPSTTSGLTDMQANSESHSATSSPIPAFAQPRKRGGFRRKGVAARARNPSPDLVVAVASPQGVDQPPPPSALPADTASPSKRLRHKKINFRELLKGEDGTTPTSSPLLEGGDTGNEYLADLSTARGGITIGHKHAGSKDQFPAIPAKRRRKERCKSLEEKKEVAGVSPDTASEMEISVDEVSPTPVSSVKNKKRSPGASNSASLGTSARSLKSKLIKVNVRSLVHSGPFNKGQPRKKGLFGRKKSSNGSGSETAVSVDHPLHVLQVSHINSDAALDSSLDKLSPAADVHLDLYQQPSSLCVLCHICKTYMSVADFLKHQHLGGSQDLVEVAHQRKLVPFHKDNLTADEREMWLKFQSLRSNLDNSKVTPLPACERSKVAKEGIYCSSPPELVIRQKCIAENTCSIAHENAVLGTEENAVLGTENSCLSPQSASMAVAEDVFESNSKETLVVNGTLQQVLPRARDLPLPLSTPVPLADSALSKHTQNEEKLVISATVLPDPSPVPMHTRRHTLHQQRSRKLSSSPTNVRTSSRQRQSKRFFGCENYEFTAGGKRSSQNGEDDGQDADVDVLDGGDVNLSSSTSHLHPTGSVLHESESG